MKREREFEIEESLLKQLDTLAQTQQCGRDEIIREALASYFGSTDSRLQPSETSKGDPT